MRTFIFSTIGLLTLIFSSCKKETEKPEGSTSPTVTPCTGQKLPGDYFPAFPGSWWKYTTNNGDTVTYTISSDYQTCLEECRPVFLNADKCIDGNSMVIQAYHGLGVTSYAKSPIYSLIEDSTFVCPVSFVTFQAVVNYISPLDIPFRRRTVTADTSIVVNGTPFNEVLVVYEFSVQSSTHRYYDYFAKNIGLVKRDSVSAVNSQQLITIMTLGSYHVE